jgi:hypothetical protein
MQVERLHERVAVRADFRGGVITPVLVARASGERMKVEGVAGRWVDRSRGNAAGAGRGGAPCYHFTIRMAGATYEIAFDAAVPEWWLERVMLEG